MESKKGKYVVELEKWRKDKKGLAEFLKIVREYITDDLIEAYRVYEEWTQEINKKQEGKIIKHINLWKEVKIGNSFVLRSVTRKDLEKLNIELPEESDEDYYVYEDTEMLTYSPPGIAKYTPVVVFVSTYNTGLTFTCPYYKPYSDVDKTCITCEGDSKYQRVCRYFPTDILLKIQNTMNLLNAYAPICYEYVKKEE